MWQNVIQMLLLLVITMLLCRYIDQGRNPQLYTKDCLEKALEKNQQVNGKIDAYKDFSSLLVTELSKHFPKEIEEYQKIKQKQLKP